MNDFEGNYRESTIVNPRARSSSREEDLTQACDLPAGSSFGSDLITLSSDQPPLSAGEEQQAAWLKANRNRNSMVAANKVFTFRPPTMVMSKSMAKPSAMCFYALNAAAGRFA